MNTKKSLAKVFGPVLLLTATLALPMDTAFAAKDGRAAAHAQADKHEKNKKGKQQRQRGPRVEQRKQVQKQAEVRRQQSPRRQKAVQQHRIERQKEQKRAEIRRQQTVRQNRIERQQALQQQQARQIRVERQQALQRQQARQNQLERQRALEHQRALERQRALQRQRQNQVYRNDRYYDDRYYAAPRARRGGGGADPSVFHVDGYLDDGGDCLFLRDHEGRTWAMVGNTYGLQPGEHVRLYGRPTDGGVCGYRGAAFDIYEVRTVWADQNHRRTYYDHLYDGAFDQNRAYEDDRYYNGTYDPYEDRDDRDSWWERLFGG